MPGGCRQLESHHLVSHLILKSDIRKTSLTWSPVTESNRRPSPYHLGAKRSIGVIGAGQRTLAVIYGRCRTVRLLHFAAASRRAQLTFGLTLRMRRVVPAGEDHTTAKTTSQKTSVLTAPHFLRLACHQIAAPNTTRTRTTLTPSSSLLLQVHASPVGPGSGFRLSLSLIDAAKAERGCHVLPTRMPRVCRVSVSLFDYMPQRCSFGHEP